MCINHNREMIADKKNYFKNNLITIKKLIISLKIAIIIINRFTNSLENILVFVTINKPTSSFKNGFAVIYKPNSIYKSIVIYKIALIYRLAIISKPIVGFKIIFITINKLNNNFESIFAIINRSTNSLKNRIAIICGSIFIYKFSIIDGPIVDFKKISTIIYKLIIIGKPINISKNLFILYINLSISINLLVNIYLLIKEKNL